MSDASETAKWDAREQVKVQEAYEAELTRLRAENAELKQRVAELENELATIAVPLTPEEAKAEWMRQQLGEEGSEVGDGRNERSPADAV